MSKTQATSYAGSGLAVKVNDTDIEKVSLNVLELAKQSFEKALDEVETEIIERSDPQNNGKDTPTDKAIIKKSNDKIIEVSVKVSPEQIQIIDEFISPQFRKIFDRPGFDKFPRLVIQNELIHGIMAFTPLIICALAILVAVKITGGINGRALLATLVIGLLTALMAWILLGFFNESRKYIVFQDIDKYKDKSQTSSR